MNVPDELKYTEAHEWVSPGPTVSIGVTDHAQEELTDVVFVELPEVGRALKSGEAVAVVESVKAASDVYAPVAGKVVEVNSKVEDDPSLVNTDAYGEGWLFKLELDDPGAVEALMDAQAYREHISSA